MRRDQYYDRDLAEPGILLSPGGCGELLLPCGTIRLMIAQELLEILVCPACKQALEYRQEPESLKCRQCHRVYAVKDDIPIMLVGEATIETA
jgi:uncharacterized protein